MSLMAGMVCIYAVCVVVVSWSLVALYTSQHICHPIVVQKNQGSFSIKMGTWLRTPSPPSTPNPMGGQPTRLSTRGGFPPQKVNKLEHSELPTGILTQPSCPPPRRPDSRQIVCVPEGQPQALGPSTHPRGGSFSCSNL